MPKVSFFKLLDAFTYRILIITTSSSPCKAKTSKLLYMHVAVGTAAVVCIIVYSWEYTCNEQSSYLQRIIINASPLVYYSIILL